MKLIGNAVVGQSGGPTAVINATLAGVIREILENPEGPIGTLYGMRNGIEGLQEERLIDLNAEFGDSSRLDFLEATPAAVLGSCRKKLPEPEADPGFFERLVKVFKKYDIRYFFYIGGNDSMDTVSKLSEYIEKSDYPMVVLGIPKTIDNDLVQTDHTPGFGSAAKMIAVTTQEIIRDCAVYRIPAVTVIETMGRDSGWLTAASAIGRVVNGIAPDLVYLPERVFDPVRFTADVRARLKVHPNVVVVVSEGLRYADGHYVGEGKQNGMTDVFGHAYLAGVGKVLEQEIRSQIGCKVRSVELNLPQRCSAHIASRVDVEESVALGRAGVRAALRGVTRSMMVLKRADSPEYRVEIEARDVKNIANKIRLVDDRFINEEGNNVTDECCRYLLPLIQGEAPMRFQGGLPSHLILD